LRHNGFAASRLVDLHSMWTVSARASSIALAVAAASVTIVLEGLQPFVIGVIPQPVKHSSAAVSHP
jgi:hypothetical protein